MIHPLLQLTPGQFSSAVGQPGSGKTMYAVSLAYAASLRGHDVWSNFDIDLPGPGRFYRITDIESLVYIRAASPTLLVLDEMHTILDSRSFSSGFITALSRWFMFIRKFNLALHYTTQSRSMVDTRVRGLTHYVAFCGVHTPYSSLANLFYLPEPNNEERSSHHIRSYLLVHRVWGPRYRSYDYLIDVLSESLDPSDHVVQELQKQKEKQQKQQKQEIKQTKQNQELMTIAIQLAQAQTKEDKKRLYGALQLCVGGK